MTTVLIDNYDSFSYNLYQLLGTLDDMVVLRNDAKTPQEVLDMNPDRIVLSPGPGRPADAGICEDLVRIARGKVPILGVCLGHQAICEAYGATVGYAKCLMHGKVSEADLADSPLFEGLPRTITVGRYHSLAADAATLPSDLVITSSTSDGEVMSVEDPVRKVYGLQFHPESILTPDGPAIMANFMKVRI
ncbi:MAG: aminodeoxychorismate/anthranilate synthase component II [Thermoplasmata archaeon]|nr:aminodeoxychorismate/anthranilate synthase component II [Thermoplasmata archaeon]